MDFHRLSPYDKTSIIGNRLSQIANGAKSVLSVEELKKCKNVKDVVYMELNTRKIPLMIKRILPNGEIVELKIDENTIIS